MKTVFLFLVLVAGMIDSLPLQAEEKKDISADVMQLVKEGKLLSSETLLKRYAERLDGRLLDIKAEREKGRVVYEFEIMRADSVIYEIEIDAATGEWLEEEAEK